MLLKKFKTTNYRCFKKEIVVDFSKTRDYSDFSPNIMEHVDSATKTSVHSLLYGYNGSGKSSLSLALMDIIINLTDFEKTIFFDGFYFNLFNYKNNSRNNYASFEYTFYSDGSEIVYKYTKSDISDMVREEIIVNNKSVIKYCFGDLKDENYIKIAGFEHLAYADLSTKNSIIRYLFTFANCREKFIVDIVDFASHMLYFRSTPEGNRYAGLCQGMVPVFEYIAQMHKIPQLQSFLEQAGIKVKLVETIDQRNGRLTVGALYNNNRILYDSIASSGTRVLCLFYYWSLNFSNLSFLIIDEYDAYYHNKLAQFIYKTICDIKCQTLVTTQNETILDYEMTRPDCVYLINTDRFESLSNLANEYKMKEIRKGNSMKNICKKFLDNLEAEKVADSNF